jgi:hypothetical protein
VMNRKLLCFSGIHRYVILRVDKSQAKILSDRHLSREGLLSPFVNLSNSDAVQALATTLIFGLNFEENSVTRILLTHDTLQVSGYFSYLLNFHLKLSGGHDGSEAHKVLLQGLWDNEVVGLVRFQGLELDIGDKLNDAGGL